MPPSLARFYVGAAYRHRNGRTLSHRARSTGGPAGPGGVRSLTLKRIALTAATAFAAVNIWTGCPLLALWVASQASGEHRITMPALGVFLITVALLEGVTIVALAWLNNVYDDVTGRRRVERRPPWLRSMSEAAERHVSQRVGISLPERIVIIIVYFAVIAFAVWYVFFAAATSYLHCIAQGGC
jgi:hypothetical protein